MRHKIVGNHPIDGVDPGGHVDIDDPVQARQLVRGGHLVPAEQHVCTAETADGPCGFEAKSARGLASHQRTHDSEDD